MSVGFVPRVSSIRRVRRASTGGRRIIVGYDMRSRIAGAAILVAAAAAGFGSEKVGSASGSIGELALQLVAFSVACFGILLVIEGEDIRRRWRDDLTRRSSRSDERGVEPLTSAADEALLMWDMGLGGGRSALAAILIMRAQQRSAAERKRYSPTDKQHPPAAVALGQERH